MIERWLAQARDRLDPVTGLLPHRVDPDSGAPLEGARGSSQGLIARFLVEIDPPLAREHYLAFRRRFISGLPGVREYPRGVDGVGDVDSGPLVAGVSASASVVTLGAARVHGDTALAGPLSQAAEAAGLPVQWDGRRRYAFGLLPVGDAFLLWSRTARPWVASAGPAEFGRVLPRWWRLPWHAGSALFLALASLPALVPSRRHSTRRRR